MANPKGKKQKRQAERKRQLRLEVVARHAASTSPTTHSSPSYSGMSSPFCLRSGSNPTTSVLYRQTAPTDHAHQLSFSACGSNRVAWFNRADLLL
jgi:hypothetical protein